MKNNGELITSTGSKTVSMVTNDINEQTRLNAIKTFNDVTNKASEMFKNNIEKELEESRKIKQESTSLEIMPTNGYILVRIYDKNPYAIMKTTASGLIIGSTNGKYKSDKTGEEETEDLAVKYAEVMEVGPEVKYIKPGDDIIFRNHTQLPAPFLGQDFWVVGQNNVIVTINENLKKRFDKESK